MSLVRPRAGVAGLLFVVLGSAPLTAQDTTAPPVPDSVQAMVSEFQQLNTRLQQTQMQALQGSAELQSEQQELQESIRSAVVETDPAMEAKIDSLPELQQAAMAAQQAGDTARIQTIMAKGRRIQAQVQQAQQDVMEQEELAQEVEAFQERLMTAMEEIDPEIGTVVDRLETLSARLQAMQIGG